MQEQTICKQSRKSVEIDIMFFRSRPTSSWSVFILDMSRKEVECMQENDSYMKNINLFWWRLQLEGITNEYNTPYLIDLVTKGSVIIPDLELPVPERFVRPEQRKHLYVPGSATAEVTLVGRWRSHTAVILPYLLFYSNTISGFKSYIVCVD